MYVYVPPPPSPEARDLGAKVAELVRLLKQENPDLQASDIRRGLQLAERELSAEIGVPRQVMVLLLALLLGCAVLVGVYASYRGLDYTVLMIVVGVAVAGLAAFVAWRSRA